MADDAISNQPDDASIPADAKLLRIILPAWVHREEGKDPRPASISFTDRRSGMTSVYIEGEVTPADLMDAHPDKHLCRVPASVPRAYGLKIIRDPENGGPAHAVICPSPEKKSAKAMAAAAEWVVFLG